MSVQWLECVVHKSSVKILQDLTFAHMPVDTVLGGLHLVHLVKVC